MAQKKNCASVISLQEAQWDSKKGRLQLRVIEAGHNKSGTRYYGAEMLRRDAARFGGVKMFANHQTEQEERQRPEGSLHNWVGNVLETWFDPTARAVLGKAVVHDDSFKRKLDRLAEHQLLAEMGVSIRAVGEGRETQVDGRRTYAVERIADVLSVDFVTYAGAGGRIEALESAGQAEGNYNRRDGNMDSKQAQAQLKENLKRIFLDEGVPEEEAERRAQLAAETEEEVETAKLKQSFQRSFMQEGWSAEQAERMAGDAVADLECTWEPWPPKL